MLFYIFCDLTNDIPIIGENFHTHDGEKVFENFIMFFGLDQLDA